MTEDIDLKWWDDPKKYPLRQPMAIAPELLSFDVNNPRYTPDKGLPHETDNEIIQFYDQTSDLSELIQSISQSGYVGIEPMIVIGRGDKLVVLEGNRRLAALRLLTTPKLAGECGISLPAVTAEKKKTLTSVTIYRVKTKEEARDYIGFKHINGPHKWDSYAKAKYAVEWLDVEEAKKGGLTLKDIANRMGDGHSTILRMVNGYRVLQQAIQQNLFSIDDREKKRQFSFSHLYTALTRTGIKKYLAIDKYENNELFPTHPITSDKFSALGEVMLWIYGSDSADIKAVVRTQNPDIKKLSEVLENPKARAMLIGDRNLVEAYAEVDPPSTQFERHLVASHKAIEKSMGKVAHYTGDPVLMDLAEEVDNNIKSLLSIMATKIELSE